MARLNRRRFLTGSAAAGFAAGFAIGGTKSSGRVLGANDSVRVAVAGLNGRGASHVGAYAPMKGVEITYLVDPDTRTYAKHLKTIERAGGSTPQTVQDIRRALDDKNIDAVSVATPNHWHALITVWACQAEKDVYVEKPCSHNVHEGRVAVEAARKYGRIVQHGTQGRSMPEWWNIAALVKSGRYGKLRVSRALCYKPRGSIGFKPNGTPPEQVDFDLWVGPAPMQPFHANLVHYNWHWFWDFGNGDIGNQGVHQMDIARWMIPGATLPKSVLSLGGRFGYEDQGQTPNTQLTVLDYGHDTQILFEVRGLKTGDYLGQRVGNILHLDEGTIAGNKFYPKGSKEGQALPKADATKRDGSEGGHFGNFIAAVRSRRVGDLHADILEGHYSSALCHLANTSYRLGELVPFDKSTKALGDDKAAYETLDRMKEHLRDDNGLKLDGLSYRLGRRLAVNAATETTDSPEANAFLTRQYRKPFVVPEKIG